ncbi:hypothetical protein [Vibrio coralliilyticus]|uniref:hypothetical protein n=1 Tax=Vibrio coralliilyticus TaxID=190893 RepID=UPI00148CCF11|nr:hypothetical protein [Vibrio coralliilyticus]NOI31895.1 hypothetical protein [Vibrio coralliilyticus]NOI51223.1 hypothetical protein [Vibrio coralliilyticus]
MKTIQIELKTTDQATHLCTMAEHFLSDIRVMSVNADVKTLNHLGELKAMWEQISERSLAAIAVLEEEGDA